MATAKTPRPSPTESASEFEIGTIRIGNDENEYIVAVDKNGRHRWAKHQKVTKNKKSPQVSDNEEVEQEQPKPKAKRVSKKKQTEQVEEPKNEEQEQPKPKAKRISKKKQVEQVEQVEEPKVEEMEKPKEVKKHVRKAPVESAKNYEEGYEMVGEDGKMHVVKLMNNNVKRWVHAH